MESIIKRECIVFDIDEKEKEKAILELVKKLKNQGNITDTEMFLEDVLATENVLKTAVCFGRLKNKILWNEETGEFAQIIILIAVPSNDEENTHMKIISRLARKLMHKEFIDKLFIGDKEEIFNILKEGLGE